MCGCAVIKQLINGKAEQELVTTTMSPDAEDAIAKAAAQEVQKDLARVVEYDFDFTQREADARPLDKIDRIGLNMIFHKYDADGSGRIGINEFRSALSEVVGKDIPKDYIRRILEAFDKDKSGEIEMKEFERMVATFRTLHNPTSTTVEEDVGSDNKFKEAFKLYDKDNSGTIGRSELQLALERAGLGKGCKVANLVLEKFDSDRSGDISFDEFRKLVKTHGELVSCWATHVDATVADYSADVDETGKAGRVNGVVQGDTWKHVFDRYDSDGSGKLEKKELRKVFKHLGIQVDQRFMKQFLSIYDVDGTGDIDFDEFRVLVSNCERCGKIEKKQDDHLKAVFDGFDGDHDGNLIRVETESACREVGVSIDSQGAQKILDEFASDHDGLINLKTFAGLVATYEVLNYGSIRHEAHPPLAAIEKIFKQFDQDRSGYIERTELNNIFKRVGLDPGSKEFKLIMAKFDEEASFGLSLKQFAQIVESYKTLRAFVES